MFTELPIPEYLDKMADTTFPSPKGGSALAIVGALGASLGEMCSQVSANRHPQKADYKIFIEKFKSLREKFLKLADADARAVYEMLQVNKKAKEQGEECELVRKGYSEASDSLFYIGEGGKELMDLASSLEPFCASSCIIDLEIVLTLAQGIRESIEAAIGDNYKIASDKGCPLGKDK